MSTTYRLYSTANLKLKPGVTLGAIAEIFAPFLREHGMSFDEAELEKDKSLTEGLMSFGGGDEEHIEIDLRGELSFGLYIGGPGHGIEVTGLDALTAGLNSVLAEAGQILLVDTDAPADSEESGACPQFVGPDEYSRNVQQVKYGLGQAQHWLDQVLGRAGFDKLWEQALAMVPTEQALAR